MESGIQVPLSKESGIQHLESEIHGVESRIQDRSLTWGDLHTVEPVLKKVRGNLKVN